MTKAYADHIKTGELSHLDAIKNQSVRDGAKAGMHGILKNHAESGLPADAAAFGALDAIAVNFVRWYGADRAGEIFRHYAEVAERLAGRDANQSEMPLDDKGGNA